MASDADLLRREELLGIIRQLAPRDDLIGLSLLPFKDVASDTVIYDLINPVTGIANARAEDAESELAGKDMYEQGKASILDWAVKERFSPSDVQAYREAGMLPAEQAPMARYSRANFDQKIAETSRRLRTFLDNRIEWLSINALLGSIAYNTNNVKFTVTYSDVNSATLTGTNKWDDTSNANPVQNLNDWRDTVYAASGIYPARCIISRKALQNISLNTKFAQLFSGANPYYQLSLSWGTEAVKEHLQRITEMEFIEYDANYRTKAATGTVTLTRFLAQEKVLLLPPGNLQDNEMSLGETLSSPHPEGDWNAGFYSWQVQRRDPWGYDVGAGIKAFPALYQPKTILAATVW